MFFHVYIFEPFDEGGHSGRSFYFRNLDEEALRTRIVDAWDRGTPVTWDGETANPFKAKSITVFASENRASDEARVPDFQSIGDDVTNEWILGPPGRLVHAATHVADTPESSSLPRDPRRVMVVHGRNVPARDAMFNFLRALGLSPIEWEEAVGETGVASPHNLDAVRAAMDVGQAVVVLLTAEDRAGLLPDLASGNDEDTLLRGQPRQNVILEAGLAMGVDRARVILVELGPIRRASDFDGLNVVRLTNAPASRLALRNRLQSAGCEIDDSGTSDWTRPEAGSDFEAVVSPWTPTPVV